MRTPMYIISFLLSIFDYLVLYISAAIWVTANLLSTFPLWIQIFIGLLMTSPCLVILMITWKIIKLICIFLRLSRMLFQLMKSLTR
nr:TPA_asm: P overlapped [Morinda alphacytorhabdovirus 1_Ile]